MKDLIIIRGNSGSGKSTVAKQLQHAMGYQTMLVPQDMVRRDMLRTRDTPDNPSIELIRRLVHYGWECGYDVIVEGILLNDKGGDMLRQLTEDCPGRALWRTIWISRSTRRFVDTPPSQTRTSSARRTCADGGARKTTSACRASGWLTKRSLPTILSQ